MPNITDTISTPDGTCTVRLFTPEGDGPWPGVVMYPDAGGVRETFDEMGAKLADFGYAVLVPDVYYRLGGWEPIDMKTAFGDPEERKRLMSMIGSVTPETMTTGRDSGNSANAVLIVGNMGADTTTTRARLSASIKANSPAVSCVLTATGTTPALIAPRKAVGKSIVSWRQRRMRCSG